MRLLHKHILAIVALTVVPGMKTIARAQDLGGLPACAQPALLAAFQASGCKATDAACLCWNPNLLTSLQESIQACSPADQAAVIAFGESYCGKQVSTTTTSSPVLPNALSTATSTSTSYQKSMTYSTIGTAMASSMSMTPTGGAAETGLSAAALVVAVGGMGWLFAEL